MEIKVLEQGKKKMIFNVLDYEHETLNFLKNELWNDSNVEAAGYQIEHPLKNTARFVVETKANAAPKAALLSALKKMKKTNDKFKAAISKSIR